MPQQRFWVIRVSVLHSFIRPPWCRRPTPPLVLGAVSIADRGMAVRLLLCRMLVSTTTTLRHGVPIFSRHLRRLRRCLYLVSRLDHLLHWRTGTLPPFNRRLPCGTAAVYLLTSTVPFTSRHPFRRRHGLLRPPLVLLILPTSLMIYPLLCRLSLPGT